MTAVAMTRGHPLAWDAAGARWVYRDTRDPAPGYGGVERPCVHCGLVAGANGHDPCLTGLPSAVTAACCGHGVADGYILWGSKGQWGHPWVRVACGMWTMARADDNE